MSAQLNSAQLNSAQLNPAPSPPLARSSLIFSPSTGSDLISTLFLRSYSVFSLPFALALSVSSTFENRYCLHFPRFSFSDSGFFSCSQTKSQGSASRYIVCISSYPEQVEFSSVCICQHFSFLHFLRRLDKRTFFIRAA